MDTRLRVRRSMFMLGCMGLGSALLTIGAEQAVVSATPGQVARSLVGQFYVGGVFGLLIAACLVAQRGPRSILKGLAFVASSAGAYLAATSIAVGALMLFPGVTPNSSSGPMTIPLPVFFVSGAAGAFLVVASALVLFGSFDLIFKNLLAGSVAGGVLGAAGWAAGPLIGQPLLLACHSLHLRPQWATLQGDVVQNMPQYFSLYVIWQTGMAALIGLLVSRAVEAQREPAPPLDGALSLDAASESASRGFSGGRNAAAALFLALVIGYLGLQVYRTVRAEQGAARRMKAYRAYEAEAPSLQNLPALSPMGWNETLVVEDLGHLFAEKPSSRLENGSPANYQYYLVYVPQKDAPFGTYQPMVRIFVNQYPNTAWANYRAKYPMGFNPALDEPSVLATVTKFGQRIVMNTMMRSANGDGALYFVWPSGNLVVTISYEMREVNEEFIKRYLALHPSSL